MQVKNPRPGDGTLGPGRPKGVPKTTALLKDARLKAADTTGGGGPEGLMQAKHALARLRPGPTR